MSLVQRFNRSGEGSFKSPFVDLLGVCDVVASLALTIDADLYVIKYL